jgi:hypothetical protein
VPDRPQQLAGSRLGGKLREKLLDGPEAGREVVAVIAVAEDGVETGQVGGVTVDGASHPDQAGPKALGGESRFSVEWRLSTEWRIGDTRW